MTRKNRLLIAIPLGIIFFLIAVFLYLTGLAFGTMAGDGCPPGVDFGAASLWLVIVWPLILLVGALVPPALILLQKRWYWVVGSVVLGAVLSAAVFFIWLMIVDQICYGGGSL